MRLKDDPSIFVFAVSVCLTCGPPGPKGLCGNLRCCVGVCAGERYLRLWDFSSRINDQSLTYNVHKARSDGTREVVHTGGSPRWAERHTPQTDCTIMVSLSSCCVHSKIAASKSHPASSQMFSEHVLQVFSSDDVTPGMGCFTYLLLLV